MKRYLVGIIIIHLSLIGIFIFNQYTGSSHLTSKHANQHQRKWSRLKKDLDSLEVENLSLREQLEIIQKKLKKSQKKADKWDYLVTNTCLKQSRLEAYKSEIEFLVFENQKVFNELENCELRKKDIVNCLKNKLDESKQQAFAPNTIMLMLEDCLSLIKENQLQQRF